MKFGYFDEKQREYVITTPKTPVKWINYIGGLEFGGFIDQTGGALLCKGDPALNRITKYIPQLPASDFNGTTLYIRIKDGDAYELITPFYTPVLDDYTTYTCHVGLGYSTYRSEIKGIHTEVTVFVPLQGEQEIRSIKVTNKRSETIEMAIIPVVEYSHFEAMKQFNNADWVPQTMQSEVVEEDNGLKTIKQYAFMRKGTQENYFTSNCPIDSFETDRERFLGDYGYGSWKKPMSLQNDHLSNYEAKRGNNMAAALHVMGNVKANGTVTLITQLGQSDNFEKSLASIKKYRDENLVQQALEDVKKNWNSYLDNFQVITPDSSMNLLVNVFNARQCMVTKNWSRFLSLYQLGLGARGIGFRDTSQDLLGAVGIAPETTIDMMVKVLSTQRRDGSAMHQFFPSTMEATNGDSDEMEDRDHYYGDDHLWIGLTVCGYVKETGDVEFLKKVVPFYDKDREGCIIESGTILEHLKRSLAFTKQHVGAHGIPYLGFADWNDTVNLPKGAESSFNANLYGKLLLEMIALMEALEEQGTADHYRRDYREMKEVYHQHCWDGSWYLRYYDKDGNPLGSSKNDEGKIYTNAQSWSILSGFAEKDRAEKAMNSVNTYLATEHGIKLSYPGYDGYDPYKGGVSTYPPGAKENGGIFLHANPWVIIAETMLGHGDRAFDYYNRINPVNKNEEMDAFEVEPYVFPQNILGDEHPQFGLGRNSWLSGTASWMYQAATQYILGIRPDYEGLIIDPCIPKAWDGFHVTRKWRKATYAIEVKNPHHVSKGVATLEMDGVQYEHMLPNMSDGKLHKVLVIMG
ncbi:glycosyl transferase [Vallitalea pronyensis]|uniref:Glycosyl transferase n=1 Tax=Vallitalea pronyensis TaxID=1348613 RepID=A0A8J8MJE2_9FIRM|nr:glycosyl transferase [Vallitalea pronyensis]QUI22358.1 glycosyl transferase [Vallitalea pronyensis]